MFHVITLPCVCNVYVSYQGFSKREVKVTFLPLQPRNVCRYVGGAPVFGTFSSEDLLSIYRCRLIKEVVLARLFPGSFLGLLRRLAPGGNSLAWRFAKFWHGEKCAAEQALAG